MRGILFALAALIALIALFAGIDTVGAMDGAHINFSWGWWAVALVFLVLTPPKHVQTRQEQIEMAFILAAQEEEDALEAWPVWEGYVPPELGALAEPPVGLACEGVEVEAGLLAPRPTSGGGLTAAQKLAIAQQRAITGELARKDLTSAEVFDLGLALIRAKKGLLV